MTKREKQLVEALRKMVFMTDAFCPDYFTPSELIIISKTRELLKQYEPKEKQHDNK